MCIRKRMWYLVWVTYAYERGCFGTRLQQRRYNDNGVQQQNIPYTKYKELKNVPCTKYKELIKRAPVVRSTGPTTTRLIYVTASQNRYNQYLA